MAGKNTAPGTFLVSPETTDIEVLEQYVEYSAVDVIGALASVLGLLLGVHTKLIGAGEYVEDGLLDRVIFPWIFQKHNIFQKHHDC